MKSHMEKMSLRSPFPEDKVHVHSPPGACPVSVCVCECECVCDHVKCANSNDFLQLNACLLKWRVSPCDANGVEHKYWQASCQIEAF